MNASCRMPAPRGVDHVALHVLLLCRASPPSLRPPGAAPARRSGDEGAAGQPQGAVRGRRGRRLQGHLRARRRPHPAGLRALGVETYGKLRSARSGRSATAPTASSSRRRSPTACSSTATTPSSAAGPSRATGDVRDQDPGRRDAERAASTRSRSTAAAPTRSRRSSPPTRTSSEVNYRARPILAARRHRRDGGRARRQLPVRRGTRARPRWC